jgi:hypothetical protein
VKFVTKGFRDTLSSSKKLAGALAIVSIGAIGTVTLLATHAATPFVSAEPENGTATAPASIVADSTASGGLAVKFAAGTSGFQANCIVSPHVCGYPDATNTGVPAGTVLTNSGCVTVSTNGATVQNLNITDCNITVNANNVTIKNVKISGCTFYPIDYSSHTGLIIQDTEISSTCSQTTAGMSFDNYTAIRMHVHGTSDGFKADNNVTIRDSYIHDLWVTADSHNDGTQSTGGSTVTLQHNTYDVGTGGVCIQFGSSDSGWTVVDNLFHCNGWMINGGTSVNNSSFTNNRFAKVAGGYGPASFDGTGDTWTGNYYDDTGAAITDH